MHALGSVVDEREGQVLFSAQCLRLVGLSGLLGQSCFALESRLLCLIVFELLLHLPLVEESHFPPHGRPALLNPPSVGLVLPQPPGQRAACLEDLSDGFPLVLLIEQELPILVFNHLSEPIHHLEVQCHLLAAVELKVHFVREGRCVDALSLLLAFRSAEAPLVGGRFTL